MKMLFINHKGDVMRTRNFTPETAGKALVAMLERIIDIDPGHCEPIDDNEGVTDHDNLMAAGIVSRIDYDEHGEEFILTKKDTLHQGKAGDKTEPDIETWAMRFLNKHGESVLRRLLARHFVRLRNEGMIGSIVQKRPDRKGPLSGAVSFQGHATA